MRHALGLGATVAGTRVGDPTTPATRVAPPAQRAMAVDGCVLLATATIILLPFSRVVLPRVPGFLPVYQTALIGTYLISAYLMYGHSRVLRSLPLMHLSAGCLYTAIVLVVQLLAFPGMVSEGKNLLFGSQTAIWLWCFWHLGPVVGACLYCWGEAHPLRQDARNFQRSAHRTLACLLAASIATTMLVTIWSDILPRMDIEGNYGRLIDTGIAPALAALLLSALLLLWRQCGFKSVLQLWLGMSLFALLCDNLITMAGAARFTVGWYAGRLNALLSSAIMMLIYLHEINRSHLLSVATTDRLILSYAQLELIAGAARLDALTKLPGRELFMEQAEMLRAASVAAATGFATLFIDLDGFKAINDRYGHEHGDMILVQVAAALHEVLRETDVASRIGGDEFVACLAGPKDLLQTTRLIAHRIIERIGKIGDGVGVSVGYTLWNADLTKALHQADEAMYDAKILGRNHAALYSPKPGAATPAASYETPVPDF